jgi:hypothetical protein
MLLQNKVGFVFHIIVFTEKVLKRNCGRIVLFSAPYFIHIGLGSDNFCTSFHQSVKILEHITPTRNNSVPLMQVRNVGRTIVVIVPKRFVFSYF